MKKGKENEWISLCERMFIIRSAYNISAVFSPRLVNYTLRNDETNATGIERKWKAMTVVGLEGKQDTKHYEFDDGISNV